VRRGWRERRRGQDLMHGRAHGLHDFGWEVVEADHGDERSSSRCWVSGCRSTRVKISRYLASLGNTVGLKRELLEVDC
jgi:hypothetical protein